MNKAWDDLDKRSKALEQRMLEVGITKPAGSEEELLRFNVGGAPVTIRRSALEGRGYLGCLLESVWDNRLPRDSDGFIVLDQSPTCVKCAIHTLVNLSVVGPSGMAKLTPDDGLPPHEKSYLPYVASALGLAEHLRVSAVLEHDEFGPVRATILDLCPGKPFGLELVYRASRDGWAPEYFFRKCGDDSPSTVTLYRVSNTGRETRDSVVGGFSSVPWTPATGPSFRSSPGAFLFMLKDGAWHRPASPQPVKWDIKEDCEGRELYCDFGTGPCFAEDLELTLQSSSERGRLAISNGAYKIPKGSPFLSLHGNRVVEMETFRVCYPERTASPPAPKPGLMDIPSFEGPAASTEGSSDDDICSFGVSIAGSLTEEKLALRQGHNDLAEANAKAAASVDALATVYGPHVAAGKEDSVIELSVRGTRMTTLRSTLQACPDSALAARFDDDKWPATDKDVDERGRRVIDCSASVFSKVLDVLRMRKRATWPAGKGRGHGDARIAVKPGDRAAFEEFVGMYFPGCEDFIMDYVANNPAEPTAGS